MSDQMLNYEVYKESLKNTPGPVLSSQIPKVKMDLAGLSRYAKNKGVSVADLTPEERQRFIPSGKFY